MTNTTTKPMYSNPQLIFVHFHTVFIFSSSPQYLLRLMRLEDSIFDAETGHIARGLSYRRQLKIKELMKWPSHRRQFN